MISTRVNFKVNQGALDQMLRSPGGLVGRSAKAAAEKAAQRARADAPVDTGAYRDSIKAGPVEQTGNGVKVSVTSDSEYARSIEFKQRPVLRNAVRGVRTGDFRPH